MGLGAALGPGASGDKHCSPWENEGLGLVALLKALGGISLAVHTHAPHISSSTAGPSP